MQDGEEVNAWSSGIRRPVDSMDVVMEEAQQLSEHGVWPVPSARTPSAQAPSEQAASGVGNMLADPLAP
jgi:hypothetical protein